VHQQRLGGNFDACALWKNHAAAMDDVEDGDGLARFALGVERIAAEIYEIERDSENQQYRPCVARLGYMPEPIRRVIGAAGSRGASYAGMEAGPESAREISSGTFNLTRARDRARKN